MTSAYIRHNARHISLRSFSLYVSANNKHAIGSDGHFKVIYLLIFCAFHLHVFTPPNEKYDLHSVGCS